MPAYTEERLDAWAKGLFAELQPDLFRLYGWDQFRNTPTGLLYRDMAAVAIKLHLRCCERRCEKCGEALVHNCLRCDRS